MHGGFGVEPGSAARDAEERARESGATPFRGNVGIRVSRQAGQKFEFEARPSGPGEALPIPKAGPEPEARPPVVEPRAPSAAARIWGKFRGLFSRK